MSRVDTECSSAPDRRYDGESALDTHRAILNMLDDFAVERTRLENAQRATVNILEDFAAAADEIRRANQELVQLDKLKNEFVAMASHELRTPLTSIAGFSATMLSQWQTLSDEAKYDYVGIIESQAQRLTRLVEGLLTISTIEGGALKTSPSTINVSEAIRKTVRQLDAEGVDVSCEMTLAVRADRDHFQQIMVNYVSNAIKHGRAPISIEAHADLNSIHIRVTDCGEGVPEPFVQHLFERFAQADDDHSRNAVGGMGRGAGLGLSIVHALAVAQGGDAWYEPHSPTGSCFNVRLPAA